MPRWAFCSGLGAISSIFYVSLLEIIAQGNELTRGRKSEGTPDQLSRGLGAAGPAPQGMQVTRQSRLLDLMVARPVKMSIGFYRSLL